MGKTGLLFSGQGSQYVNMGKDLYYEFDIIKSTYDKASEFFGFDVLSESVSGDNFLKTGFSQPCVFTLSISILEYLKSAGFKYDGTAGFSLGECTALYGSGITTLNDTIKIVNYRSQAMQRASENGNGAMMAVLGMSIPQIEDELSKLDGFCIPVNYNCDGQTVIAGDLDTINKAEITLKEAGAKRCVKLQVSSAFHTKYMNSAAVELEKNISSIDYNKPNKDFYTNIDGNKLNEIILGEHLKKQMTNPVLFQTLITNMINDGYDTFVEIGPGKILSGFVKRINSEVKIFNIENLETLTKGLIK